MVLCGSLKTRSTIPLLFSPSMLANSSTEPHSSSCLKPNEKTGTVGKGNARSEIQ